jgi:hypothetical protein
MPPHLSHAVVGGWAQKAVVRECSVERSSGEVVTSASSRHSPLSTLTGGEG